MPSGYVLDPRIHYLMEYDVWITGPIFHARFKGLLTQTAKENGCVEELSGEDWDTVKREAIRNRLRAGVYLASSLPRRPI